MKKRYKLASRLIGLSIILSINIACVAISSQNNVGDMPDANSMNSSQSNVQEFKSKVEELNAIPWNVKTTQLDKDVDVIKIYFFNETVGYIITSLNTIYKTLDGGESWKKISSLTAFALKDIFFISPTEGFVITYKSKLLNNVIESCILKTEDGGRNWRVIYSSESTNLEKLVFNSKGLGLAVGERKIITPEQDSANYVLFTDNKGQTWTDVSENLNRIAVNNKGRIADYLTDIKFSESKGIFVISSLGKLYNSTDDSKSWKLVSKLVDEPPQTAIRQLGILEDGKFWIAGGTISEEGKWGIIAITKNQIWNKYRLNEYYFSDVEFLSNNEVIACGSAVAMSNFGGATHLDKGVILFSSDNGKNWVIVHQSQSSSKFTSIAKLSEHKLFVAGKNGVGIFLDKKVNNSKN